LEAFVIGEGLEGATEEPPEGWVSTGGTTVVLFFFLGVVSAWIGRGCAVFVWAGSRGAVRMTEPVGAVFMVPLARRAPSVTIFLFFLTGVLAAFWTSCCIFLAAGEE
jgi:hypothetical protein